MMEIEENNEGFFRKALGFLEFLSPSKVFTSWTKKRERSDDDKDETPKKKQKGEKMVGSLIYYRQLGSNSQAQPSEPALIKCIDWHSEGKKFALQLEDGRTETCKEEDLLLRPIPWHPRHGHNRQTELDELLSHLAVSSEDVKSWGQVLGIVSKCSALLPPEAGRLVALQLRGMMRGQERQDQVQNLKLRTLLLRLVSFASNREPAGCIAFIPSFVRAGGAEVLSSWAADPQQYDVALINYLSSLLELPTLNTTARNLVERLRSQVFVSNQKTAMEAIVAVTKSALEKSKKPEGQLKAALDFWRSTIKRTEDSVLDSIIQSEFLEVLVGEIPKICQTDFQPAWKKSYLFDLLKVWTSVSLRNSFVQTTLFEAIHNQSGAIEAFLGLAAKDTRSKENQVAAHILLGMESCASDQVRAALSNLDKSKVILEKLKEEFPKLAKNRTDLLKTHVSKRKKV